MSNDSFKVKKSLTLTPARMVDIINPQAGDLACDIDDNNKIKRYNDQKLSWEEIGSGGQDSSQLLDNGGFEEVERSWTLTAGVSSINPDPVVGDYCLEVSLADEALELFQDSTLNQTALSDGVQGLAYIRVKTALSGIKVCFRQAGVTSTNLCVDVNNNNKWGLYKLPVILGGTSNGIAVTSEGVVKTGTIIVDDAFVGAQDVKQDVSACNSIECETEFSAKVSSTGVVSSQNYDFVSANCSNVSSGNYICTFNTGVFSAAPNCLANLSNPSSTTSQSASAHGETVSSVSVRVLAGGGLSNQNFTLLCQRSGSDFTNAKLLAGGSIYSTASDSFSTDTNTLTHKPSVAITAADPIGTFNTYSYAANSNTRTICTAAPSTLPTKADGFRIFTRAFNAASTCGNPARVEIKIAQPGTSLPTLQANIYKNTGKSIIGSMSYNNITDVATSGPQNTGYEESTGVYIFDSARNGSPVTSAIFSFSDVTGATSGYLVINAQKMKDAIVGDFKALEYVYVEAAGNAGQAISVTTTKVPFIEITDTHNSWDGNTFTVPVDGIYQINASVFFSTTAARVIGIWLGEAELKRIDQSVSTTYHSGLYTGFLSQGSTLSIRVGGSGGSLVSARPDIHYLTITRIPGQF